MSLAMTARTAIAAALLAGCTAGDYASDRPGGGGPALARLVGAAAPPAVTVVPPAPASAGRAIRTRIDYNRAVATMTLATTRNGYQIWVAPDRQTVTLRGDVVSATRGLLIDLLAAETDLTAAALRARRDSPPYQRTYRYTDGTRGIRPVTYDCKMTRGDAQAIEVDGRRHQTLRMVEECTGPTGVVRNDFWIGADGVTWRSRQYLEPNIGYITIDRLAR